MLNLLLQEIRFRRNAIIGWGIGLCFFPVVYVGLYPSFADQMASFQEIMDLAIYQALGITMASFEGYMASTVTNLVPVLLSIYAVSNGTDTLAGEEDNGRLELILALPLPRRQIVLVKAIALAVSLLLILTLVGLGAALTLAAILPQITTEMTAAGIFLGLLSAWPLVFAFGMISLFLGAFCPSRRIAVMLATVVVIVSFLGSNLAGMIESLERVEPLFLFHYFQATGEALLEGQRPMDLVTVVLIGLAALGLAILFFQRRDVTVGLWPWQKGKAPREAQAA